MQQRALVITQHKQFRIAPKLHTNLTKLESARDAKYTMLSRLMKYALAVPAKQHNSDAYELQL